MVDKRFGFLTRPSGKEKGPKAKQAVRNFPDHVHEVVGIATNTYRARALGTPWQNRNSIEGSISSFLGVPVDMQNASLHWRGQRKQVSTCMASQ